MINFDSIPKAPASLKLKKLSFVSWLGEIVNFSESFERSTRSFSFGYLLEGDESRISVAGAAIEEPAEFPLATRSMIWRIAEIKIERQNEWLIFSRQQDNLSHDALSDFLIDCRNYLEHLRDEHKRLNPV